MAIALFIGLLTLFAIIQGFMMTAKGKEIDVFQSRKKRDLMGLSDIAHMVMNLNTTICFVFIEKLLLNFFIFTQTHEQLDILRNDVKVRCIQRTICQESSQLRKDFGPKGVKLAKYLMFVKPKIYLL